MNTFTRIFISRKVWVALAASVGVILSVFGLDPAKWTPVISSIVVLATTVIAAMGYEDGQEKSNRASTIPSSPAPAATDDNVAPGASLFSDPTKTKPLNVLLVALLLGVALSGVGCSTPVGPDYLAADRATFEAVGPSYLNYVADDATLTAEQKLRRQRTVTTWQMRIESQEKLAGPATTQPGTN